MLSKIDAYLIRQHKKNSKKLYGKFNNTWWGYTITSLFVLYCSIMETTEKWEEGAYALSVIFLVISMLIFIYALLHLFRKKNVERFEYRLKLFETLILIYTGYEKWHARGIQYGFGNIKAIKLLIANTVLVTCYLLLSRMLYLKHKGRMEHSN